MVKVSNKSVPIALLTGYLGAGKTTLVNYILANQKKYKMAVIVNDIGSVNIDESLIDRNGIVTSKDDSLVPLTNGCICCTLKTDLIEQISQLVLGGKFDYILIEASGICEPLPIAQTITYIDDLLASKNLGKLAHLDNIISVVDSYRMANEFGCGDELLAPDIDEEDITALLVQQIEFCNTVLLNKSELVNREQLDQLHAVVKALCPSAKVVESSYGKVDLDELLETDRFDFEKASMSAGWIEALNNPEDEEESEEVLEYGIDTCVYYRRTPFNRVKFEKVVNNWPKNIIRTKGLCWFVDDQDTVFMYESAGKQVSISDYGCWVAALDPATQAQVLQENPDVAETFDPIIGDRMNKIVIIGQDLDKEKITADLDACLMK